MLETINEEQRQTFLGKINGTIPRLSERQLTMLNMIADGQSRSKIAAHVGLHPSTVNTYLKRLLHVFDAENKAHMIAKAFRMKILR
jgi:DNA-binding CsgD family transcriptional regulator